MSNKTVTISKENLNADTVRNTLRDIYKPARYEGRDGQKGCLWVNYSDSVTKTHLVALTKHGASMVSRHDSQCGSVVKITLSE